MLAGPADPAGTANAPAGHMALFDAALPPGAVTAQRAVLQRYLGDRPALQPGQRDAKWWINLGNLVDLGAADVAQAVLRRFCATPLLGWARERLGPDLVFVLEYCIMRRFDPSRNPVPAKWHFDANIFGLTSPMVNFWMPLVDVGETAPGLTLADMPRRPAPLWARMAEIAAGRGGGFDAENRQATLFSKDEVVTALSADPEARLITPRLRAGGAIAFDQQFLHGTQALAPGMGIRDSLEIRLLPLDLALSQRLTQRYRVAKAPGCRAT